MSVKTIFSFLLLLPMVVFPRIWYIGYEPGDFNGGRNVVKSVIEDSCSYGDTVFFREGEWIGLENVNKGQFISGAPGTDRDSVRINNGVYLYQGTITNLNFNTIYSEGAFSTFLIRQYYGDEYDIVVDNCRLAGPIEIDPMWWTPGYTFTNITIRDCIIDTAGWSNEGFISNSGICFTHSSYNTTFPANIHIYRNDFRKLVCGVAFGTNYWEGPATPDSILIHSNYWYTTDTNWVKQRNGCIWGDYVNGVDFNWRPMLEHPYQFYSPDSIDTTANGIYYNNFECIMPTWASTDDTVPSKILETEENRETRIAIYPNPTMGIINIINIDENSSLELFDMTGRRCFATSNTQNPISLPSDMEIGVYLYRIKDLSFDEPKTGKLVKLK
ncbi:MAG: T9SS type A sorting domain-containing protein [Spirochaetaceae bacterium]|nr:T9SS type A sorting domain-containing protein [Spirochaetaceae bacterium]